ncbi:hypothetical protein BC834DRAFT_904428 [Gloeopeniophorella convolvens]|nr:hypothetical protein BC834DRAFT_904428 [Gloeopeniophorella convolvens]
MSVLRQQIAEYMMKLNDEAGGRWWWFAFARFRIGPDVGPGLRYAGSATRNVRLLRAWPKRRRALRRGDLSRTQRTRTYARDPININEALSEEDSVLRCIESKAQNLSFTRSESQACFAARSTTFLLNIHPTLRSSMYPSCIRAEGKYLSKARQRSVTCGLR